MSRRAAFVGPLPPPVMGFSIICEAMLEKMQSHMAVDVFNRAPRRGYRYRTLFQQLSLSVKYFFENLRSRRKVLYLGLSGGAGQLVDILYLGIALLFRQPTFVHHHSFAYINRRTFVSRCVFAFARSSNHIVLSEGMGTSLKASYGLLARNVRVVSNMAFFSRDVATFTRRDVKKPGEPLQIGYLSNITEEKGIFLFLAILEELQRTQVNFFAHIAGPVAPTLEDSFSRSLKQIQNVEYQGPIYGESKDAFYKRLDVFVFPTKYVNEAEPLVLYEAMSAGALVIACDRGAIPEMLAEGGGIVFSNEEILRGASKRIAEFSKNPADLHCAQFASLRRVQHISAQASQDLRRLLVDMAA